MKELSIVYAVAEFVPAVRKMLKGKNLNKNIYKIYDILHKITECESAVEIAKCLNSAPEKMIQFQNEALEVVIEEEFPLADPPPCRTNSAQSLVMVVFIALALLGCLFFMIYNGGKLSGEGISIISSVAGIFGACLKDAFSAIFGTQNSANNAKILNN